MIYVSRTFFDSWFDTHGSVVEAERAVPGKGCEVIAALSSVGDMGLVVGLVCGVALAVAFAPVGYWLRMRPWRV